MRRTKRKGCTTVFIVLQMTHIRKSMRILLTNTQLYYEAQYRHTHLAQLQIIQASTKQGPNEPACKYNTFYYR